jgi:hypothetical protein
MRGVVDESPFPLEELSTFICGCYHPLYKLGLKPELEAYEEISISQFFKSDPLTDDIILYFKVKK